MLYWCMFMWEYKETREVNVIKFRVEHWRNVSSISRELRMRKVSVVKSKIGYQYGTVKQTCSRWTFIKSVFYKRIVQSWLFYNTVLLNLSPLCCWWLEHTTVSAILQGNTSPRFSINSEANTSEILEEMFPL